MQNIESDDAIEQIVKQYAAKYSTDGDTEKDDGEEEPGQNPARKNQRNPHRQSLNSQKLRDAGVISQHPTRGNANAKSTVDVLNNKNLAMSSRIGATDDALSDKERLEKALTINDNLMAQIKEMEEQVSEYRVRLEQRDRMAAIAQAA